MCQSRLIFLALHESFRQQFLTNTFFLRKHRRYFFSLLRAILVKIVFNVKTHTQVTKSFVKRRNSNNRWLQKSVNSQYCFSAGTRRAKVERKSLPTLIINE